MTDKKNKNPFKKLLSFFTSKNKSPKSDTQDKDKEASFSLDEIQQENKNKNNIQRASSGNITQSTNPDIGNLQHHEVEEADDEIEFDDENDDSDVDIENILNTQAPEVPEDEDDQSFIVNEEKTDDKDELDDPTGELQELIFSREDKDAIDDEFEDFVESVDESPPTQLNISKDQKEALDKLDDDIKSKRAAEIEEEINLDRPSIPDQVYMEDDSDALDPEDIEKEKTENTITKKIKRAGLLDKIKSYSLNDSEADNSSEDAYDFKVLKVKKKLIPFSFQNLKIDIKNFYFDFKKDPKAALEKINEYARNKAQALSALVLKLLKSIESSARYQKIKSTLEKSDGFNKSLKKLSSIDPKEIIPTLFATENRVNVHHFFIASFLIISAYHLGSLITASIQPDYKPTKIKIVDQVRPLKRIKYNEIVDKDLFNTNSSSSLNQPSDSNQPVINKNIVCKESDKKSDLPVKLVNSIVLQDSVKSIASVQIRSSSNLLNIREGDKVKDYAEVGSIGPDKLVIKNLKSGVCEYIPSDKKPTTSSKIKIISNKKAKQIKKGLRDTRIRNDGNRFNIKKSVVDDIFDGGFAEVLSQAKAIPLKNPDGSVFFKITEIEPGSLYNQLGMQDGDIITSINGQVFKSALEAQSLLVKLKEYEDFKLGIKRNGDEVFKDYNFD